jgi:hypothetical protein
MKIYSAPKDPAVVAESKGFDSALGALIRRRVWQHWGWGRVRSDRRKVVVCLFFAGTQ